MNQDRRFEGLSAGFDMTEHARWPLIPVLKMQYESPFHRITQVA